MLYLHFLQVNKTVSQVSLKDICSNSIENFSHVCVKDSDQEASVSVSKFEKVVFSIDHSDSLMNNKSTEATISHLQNI